MQDDTARDWVVMKFGGTSVSSAASWETICGQARKHVAGGKNVLVVVSALSGMTNLFTRLADGVGVGEKTEIRREIPARHEALYAEFGLEPSPGFRAHRDRLLGLVDAADGVLEGHRRAELLAHGELLSSALGVQALRKAGLDAHWQDARQLLKAIPETESEPLSVRCEVGADPQLARGLADRGSLHITQGFIASDAAGRTCLLGRGGSDTSAAYLAAALGAASLEIWTDVPGMFSADPRKVPGARLLRQLSYLEAQELASMGAKVLHPSSIQPARQSGIAVYIRDTNHPDEPGTHIARREQAGEGQVKGVVSRDGITVITMSNPAMWRRAGFLADAFAVFKQHGYSVDLVSTSEATVTVSLDPQVPAHQDPGRMAAFLGELEQLCRVTVYRDCVSISLVGNAIRTILGRLAAALDVFRDHHVYMVTQSANDLNLTLVVEAGHAGELVRELHRLLIEAQADARPEFGPCRDELR